MKIKSNIYEIENGKQVKKGTIFIVSEDFEDAKKYIGEIAIRNPKWFLNDVMECEENTENDVRKMILDRIAEAISEICCDIEGDDSGERNKDRAEAIKILVESYRGVKYWNQ